MIQGMEVIETLVAIESEACISLSVNPFQRLLAVVSLDLQCGVCCPPSREIRWILIVPDFSGRRYPNGAVCGVLAPEPGIRMDANGPGS